MTRLRLVGEAPAILGGIQVVLVFLLSLDAFHLTANTVALIMAAAAAVSALVVAWATKHVVWAVILGAINTVVALAAGYGFTLSETTTAAVIGIAAFVWATVNRQTTNPVTLDNVPAPNAVDTRIPGQAAA